MLGVSSEKFQRQLELEREMEENGAKNMEKVFAKAVETNMETGAVYGSTLLKNGVVTLASALDAFIKEGKNAKVGRKHMALKLLGEFEDLRTVAFLALRQVLNGITQKQSLSRMALMIADTLQKEAKLIKFKIDNPNLYQNMTNIIKSRNEHHRFASMSVAMSRNDIGFEKWTLNEKVQIGMKLIDLIISSTGYAEIVPMASGHSKQMSNYLVATAKCIEWIERCKKNALLNPEYLPTIIPPKPWTNPFDGGYYSKIKPLWLVKARFNPKNYLEELNNRISEMPTVYKAVNAIQNTPYRINTKVYEVMSTLWGNGKGEKSIMLGSHASQPICPVCGAAFTESAITRKHKCFSEPENLESFKKWKRESESVYSKNIKLFSKKLQLSKILYLADKFKDEDAIYFPMQLDFRGRVYPVPSYLQPQGSDWAKGLLEFAEGKPLESIESVKWLGIHGANLFGEDKLSFDNRFFWVLENEEKIISSASDPYLNTWWQGADKPFQFLGFCFEWYGYLKACDEGKVYSSHLPVAMDGTCNGLQIFSLLLRDEVGGKATNLIPSNKPQDIYAIVAGKVNDKLSLKAETGGLRYKKGTDELLYDEQVLAPLLLKLGIDRKATKRQVMTLPYGATFTSCKDYTKEWILMKQEENPNADLFRIFPKIFYPSMFLAELIWESIHETVVAAKNAMEYLKTLAGIVSKEQLPVVWTTPVGLKILQAYKETKTKRVKCELGGGLVFSNFNEDTLKLDVLEQKNGISPNFIHSLDAAAMMKTVDIAVGKGITNFSMVHDSYATHAANAVALAQCLRIAFIELFNDDLLTKFRNEVTNVLKPESLEYLPPLPGKGTLDIHEIMDSKYFFA